MGGDRLSVRDIGFQPMQAAFIHQSISQVRFFQLAARGYCARSSKHAMDSKKRASLRAWISDNIRQPSQTLACIGWKPMSRTLRYLSCVALLVPLFSKSESALEIKLIDILIRERERLAEQNVVTLDLHCTEPARLLRRSPGFQRSRQQIMSGKHRQVSQIHGVP
jgi:hypothetical protein